MSNGYFTGITKDITKIMLTKSTVIENLGLHNILYTSIPFYEKHDSRSIVQDILSTVKQINLAMECTECYLA